MSELQKGTGRQSRMLEFSDAQLLELEKLLEMGLTTQKLSDWFGIPLTTFLAMKKRDPKLEASYQSGLVKGQSPSEKPTRGRNGRFQFTAEQLLDLEKLLAMGATDPEVVAWFEITLPTLANVKQRDPAFAESYDRGQDKGKASLRRMMWQAAMGNEGEIRNDKEGHPHLDKRGAPVMFNAHAPSIRMQIFLATNLLGMSERQEETHGEEMPAITIVEVVRPCLPPG